MSLPPPDLKDPEGLRAYRRELWLVARWWRWIGLGVVIAGAALVLWQRSNWGTALHQGWGQAAIGLLIVGWVIALTGTVKRTRYHKRRMRGE